MYTNSAKCFVTIKTKFNLKLRLDNTVTRNTQIYENNSLDSNIELLSAADNFPIPY